MLIPILSTLVLPDVVTKKQKQPSDKNAFNNNLFSAKKPKENFVRKNRDIFAIFSKTKNFRDPYPRGDCSASPWGHFDTPPDLLAPSQPSSGRSKKIANFMNQKIFCVKKICVSLAWGRPRIRGARAFPPPPSRFAKIGAKQFVNWAQRSFKERNLPSRATAKRQGQSGSAFDSLSGQLKRSFDQKQSLRFASRRPVDAHFRFGRKAAPTPNEAKPRLDFYSEASLSQSKLSPKISTRLSQRLGSDAPSNFASKRLLPKSATDRRQLSLASRKFLWSITIDN